MNAINTIKTYRNDQAADATREAQPGERTITIRGRNPAWALAINLPAGALPDLAEVPSTYRPLVDAVLIVAAKAILKVQVGSGDLLPLEVSATPYNPANLLAAATAANSYTAQELGEMWEASATRASLLARQDYATNPKYRAAVTEFGELIIRLASPKASIAHDRLDGIMARIASADLDTEFGRFVFRRCEAIKARPIKTSDLFDVI